MTKTTSTISRNAVDAAESVHGSQVDAIDALTLYCRAVAETLSEAGVHEPHVYHQRMLAVGLDRIALAAADRIIAELTGPVGE